MSKIVAKLVIFGLNLANVRPTKINVVQVAKRYLIVIDLDVIGRIIADLANKPFAKNALKNAGTMIAKCHFAGLVQEIKVLIV